MRYTVIFGPAAIVAFSSSPIAAQDVPDGFRSALGGSFGLIHYGAGKAAERQRCPTHPGFALGVEGRTRGKWYVAAGAEGLLTISYLCDAFIPLTIHEDQVVEIWSFVEFIPGLRLRARAGRILEVGAFRIETGLGGGLVAGKHHVLASPSGYEWLWKPWYGGSLALRWTALPVGLRFEFARHAVRVQYLRYPEEDRIIHEFDEWKQFFQIAIVL